MESMCVSTISSDCKDEFICRVMNQFSRWGVEVQSFINLLEMSANDAEWFSVIEDCLNEFAKFNIEPDNFLWQVASNDYNDFIRDATIAIECRNLLDELDEIRYEIIKG